MIRTPRARLGAALLTLAGVGSPRAALAQWQTPAPQQPSAPPIAAPPQAPAPSPYGGIQAGGLAPPPPMNPPPGPGDQARVAQELDQAKEEDSGRGLSWVWLNVEGGYEHVGLHTFNADERKLTAGFIESTANGGVLGAGLGVRLLFLTIGARARAGFFSPWQLFSLGGEVGVHIPLGNLEPRFDLGFGYAGLGSLSGAVSGANDAISVRGFYARAGGGLDYFITPVFSVGAGASWELLVLTRPGLDPSSIAHIQTQTSVDSAKSQALAADGSGYGSAIAVTGVLGLHF